MVVPFAAIMLFLAAMDAANRWRHLFWGSLILLGFSLAQTAFRLWYFGDPLPNTYYLKLTGYPLLLRVSRGIEVLCSFIWQSNALLFAIPFALALRRDPKVLLLLCVLSAQLLYSAYVGGDAWEFWGGSNRYISIAMPAFFVLLAFGLARLAGFLAIAFADKLHTRHLHALRNAGFLSLIAVSVLSMNSIHGPGALAEFFLLKPPLHAGPGEENDLDVREALALADVTKPAASLLVARAGTIPYFSQRVGIDLLGKNDVHIAHEPMRRDQDGIRGLIAFRPGHMKYDYKYSVETLRPDVVVQLWQHQEEVRPYLTQNYAGVFVAGRCAFFRKGSPNVLWDRLPDSPCE
jgi:arabinofuranosyltransferase